MKLLVISENEAGQRLNKFLGKYLNEAPSSFIYKMLRKKNITLNGKKASGNEKLEENDEVKLFLAEETIEKFINTTRNGIEKIKSNLDIIYEDAHVLFLNKPAGMLSQKAKDTDISIVEHIISYMLETSQISTEELQRFRPSVCNRLDRNTSGFIIAGKSLLGLQVMSQIIKDRSIKKFYRCVVKGSVSKEQFIKGYLEKDENTNKVKILAKPTPQAKYIETQYKPIYTSQEYSVLEVELITGRSHQIRAHLASIGHPIIGDPKYGNPKENSVYAKQYGIKHQMLHSYRVILPQINEMPEISNKEFVAKEPECFGYFYK